MLGTLTYFVSQTHQVEMEDVVRGIQADITKLSKNHSHTSNTVSKLLDKSRKMSVTMKEVSERSIWEAQHQSVFGLTVCLSFSKVREKMERQAVQVKRLEANHAHLISRNHFKVLIFQVGGKAAGCQSVCPWSQILIRFRSFISMSKVWLFTMNLSHSDP